MSILSNALAAIRTSVIDLYPGLHKREDSQKITDNKVTKLIEKCELCLEPKNREELQTLSHEKYTECDEESVTEYQTSPKPLYCKDCIIKLTSGLGRGYEAINIQIPNEEHNEVEEEHLQVVSATSVKCWKEFCKFTCCFVLMSGIPTLIVSLST